MTNSSYKPPPDYALFFDLLWPYRDYFGSHFQESVTEIAAEYRRKEAEKKGPAPEGPSEEGRE